MLARIKAFGLVALVGLTATPIHAFAAGDATRGGVIAKRWCAACHQVSGDQKLVSSDVPSFLSVALQKKLTPKVLAAFLSTPHPRMPDMHLSRSEIADITAYIKGLDQ
jgi:mono/diheme cytochrome c family protein